MLPSYADGSTITSSPEVNQGIKDSRAFLTYPDTFRIFFSDHYYLFNIGNSVLTSFEVNYHPMGTPAYVRSWSTGLAAPAVVEINMSFNETNMVTRDSIGKDGDDQQYYMGQQS